MTEPTAYLVNLISERYAGKSAAWNSGRFRLIKLLSPTEKGDIVEDFAVWLAEYHGYEAERNKSRRGQWDIRIAGKTLEVKAATEDVNGSFQFNGIRYDTRYDLLLVIGISPHDVFFNIYPRASLLEMTLVSMARGSNATYKLTRRPEQLHAITEFPAVFDGYSSG